MRWMLTGLMLALRLGAAEAQTLKPAELELKLLPSRPIFRVPAENAATQPNPLTFDTTLQVCAQLTCGNGLGSWLDDALTVPLQTRGEPRQFNWRTDAPGVTGARWTA